MKSQLTTALATIERLKAELRTKARRAHTDERMHVHTYMHYSSVHTHKNVWGSTNTCTFVCKSVNIRVTPNLRFSTRKDEQLKKAQESEINSGTAIADLVDEVTTRTHSHANTLIGPHTYMHIYIYIYIYCVYGMVSCWM